MDQSLYNINIPFKDIKGETQKLLFGRLRSQIRDLEHQAEEVKAEVACLFGDQLRIGLARRNDNGVPNYYWRYRARDTSRRFYRLSHEDLTDYLTTIDQDRREALLGLEEHLIYVNHNLKYCASTIQLIDKANQEQAELQEASFQLWGRHRRQLTTNL